VSEDGSGWKKACELLGLRRAVAAAQRYVLAAMAPEIRAEVARLITKAKHAYYSGSSLIWLPQLDTATIAEQESERAIELFTTGPACTPQAVYRPSRIPVRLFDSLRQTLLLGRRKGARSASSWRLPWIWISHDRCELHEAGALGDEDRDSAVTEAVERQARIHPCERQRVPRLAG
jgi:hypothetical protein